MASPPSRKYGHSKRAQYSAFTGYVIAGLGIVLGGGLLAISLFSPSAFSGFRSAAHDVAAPAGQPAAAGRTVSRNFFEAIGAYFEAGSKNAELQREVDTARVKLAQAESVAAENRRLKALLGLQDEDQNPIATTRMVGASSSSIRRFAYLPIGRNGNVLQGMPVVAPDGLVGRILETGRRSSRVLLLNDTESLVPVRRKGDDVVAFAEGRPDGNINIRLVNLGINPLKKGDVFVTSGAGGLFRPGLPVAIAVKITADGAVANMVSNPAAADFVTIEPIWSPDLRNSAETGQLDLGDASRIDDAPASAGPATE